MHKLPMNKEHCTNCQRALPINCRRTLPGIATKHRPWNANEHWTKLPDRGSNLVLEVAYAGELAYVQPMLQLKNRWAPSGGKKCFLSVLIRCLAYSYPTYCNPKSSTHKQNTVFLFLCFHIPYEFKLGIHSAFPIILTNFYMQSVN